MSEELETVEIEVPEAFHVTDERGAEWVLCKIREARERADRAEQWAVQIKGESSKREESLMTRFGIELQQFAQSQLEGAKKKSFALPSGTMGFRSQSAKLEVRAEDDLKKWAKSHCPDAIDEKLIVPTTGLSAPARIAIRDFIAKYDTPGIEFVESIKKNVVNEHFKETGEVPSGCEYVPTKESFYIK